jgi:DNA mismatch repair protein MutL
MDQRGRERREIRVLPDHVVDQIAAGEVIERPASVVKELVENALDAGATHVTVEVDHGGKRLIRVLDNGIGMTEAETRLALTRHATSKLRALDDIYALDTMGFRGEALPSIAAVSRMTITTRTRDQVAGTQLDIEGGRVLRTSEVGAPVGTHIEVRDLLFNVPARLKFLKGHATEAAHVTDAVSKLAMVHPGVHLRLRHGNRVALDAPQHPTGLERARAILGTRLGRTLHAAIGSENGVRVEAYLAAPDLAQTTTRCTYLFVGRRVVKDRGLLQALSMGYGELIARGRFPVAILRVDVPGSDVDVNVHPQKLEVRFSDAPLVYAAVRHVVRRGVAEAPWLAEEQRGSPVRMRASMHTAPPGTASAGHTAPPGTGAAGLAPGTAAGGPASRLAVSHAAETARMLLPFGRSSASGASWADARAAAEPARTWRARPELGDRPAQPAAEQDARDPRESRAPASPAPPPPAEDSSRSLTRTAFPLAPQDWQAELSKSRTSRAAEGSPWPYDRGRLERPATGAAAAAAAVNAPAAPAVPAVIDAPAATGPAVSSVSDEARDAAEFFTRLRYIGQLDRTYLVCELGGEMVLVDQHAAHERVAFQRLRDRYQERAVPVQRLLFPKTLELAPAQGAVADDLRQTLSDMGFEIEPFGGSTYALKSVPAGLRESDVDDVVAELLDELAERGGSRALEERLDLALATIACHSAVRAGDVLGEEEVHALFRSLDGVDFKAHCPHGRPVLLRIRVDEIARRFGR